MKTLRTGFAIALGCLLLGGCSGGKSRVEEGNAAGVLHFGNGTEPQAIDPHLTTGVPESRIQEALLEGLVAKNPETLVPEPAVAESWEVSEDGRTYRFHIRSTARWSDGEPVTAEDFHWTWKRALDPGMGNEYSYMLFPLKNAENYLTGKVGSFDEVGVRVIDTHTLEVELNEPTPYFVQLLSHHSYFPLPRHVIEKFGKATDRFTPWTRPGNMVGNGAFRLVEWKLNKYVSVEKNPLYWDAEHVRLNGVVFYPTENIVTEERMFRSGQLHYTNDTPVDKIPQYRDQHPEQIRLDLYLGTYFYELNVRKPGLDDPRVRRALAMTVDRKTLVDTVLKGVNVPAYALTPPGTLGYQPPKLFDFDPEGARKLLAEAGYPDGKGLPTLEILYNTHEGHRKIAVALQQMWKKHLGIDVTMVNQEWKVYLDSRRTGDYTIARASWIGDYVDPDTFLGMFIKDGGNNRTGWSNPEYDDLILRRIPAMKTQEERFAGFLRAETILMEEMPILPIYTYSTKHLIDPAVKGMPRNILDHVSFKHIYLEPAK
ncbi:MAG TPA: peptide ABC transporter substrate-binding protein [Steroidobacteraceae bacterium]|nr:peptide ABC transporter substrate-binding protein [Steroidobacteraceae bacterium]